MNLLLAGKGSVLVVGGQENNLAHRQRVDGFRDEAESQFPGLELLPTENCGDDQKLAHDSAIEPEAKTLPPPAV